MDFMRTSTRNHVERLEVLLENGLDPDTPDMLFEAWEYLNSEYFLELCRKTPSLVRLMSFIFEISLKLSVCNQNISQNHNYETNSHLTQTPLAAHQLLPRNPSWAVPIASHCCWIGALIPWVMGQGRFVFSWLWNLGAVLFVLFP